MYLFLTIVTEIRRPSPPSAGHSSRQQPTILTLPLRAGIARFFLLASSCAGSKVTTPVLVRALHACHVARRNKPLRPLSISLSPSLTAPPVFYQSLTVLAHTRVPSSPDRSDFFTAHLKESQSSCPLPLQSPFSLPFRPPSLRHSPRRSCKVRYLAQSAPSSRRRI
jgi:hypothetical protein